MLLQYPDSKEAVTEHFLFSEHSMKHLPWEMYYSMENHVLWSFINFQSNRGLGNTQGYAHGGLLSACFDGALGSLFTMTGVSGFTANLNVDYRQPVEIPSTLLLRSHVQKREGRKLWIAGRLTSATDSALSLEEEERGGAGDRVTITFAEGKGLFLVQR
jgi:acyl-coenzyme A thioesterase PaaI-like protein